MQPQNNHRPVYIQMHNPGSVRKDILESAIKSVELLERFEYSKELRSLKREKIRHAKLTMQAIQESLIELAHHLPQAVIKRKERHMVNEARTAQAQKPLPMQTKKRQSSELKRLENEIYEIRSKLNSLSI